MLENSESVSKDAEDHPAKARHFLSPTKATAELSNQNHCGKYGTRLLRIS